MKTSDNKFIGTWYLVEWTAGLKNGETIFPFGEDAKGRITYDENGNMAVQIMKNNIPEFQSDDPLQAQPDEMTHAYSGFFSYCGHYEINPDLRQVIHQIEISSFPNWVGQNQIRYYEFKDNDLILSTDVIGSSRHKLIWKK